MPATPLNGGSPLAREKGAYTQPGQLVVIPVHAGAPTGISVDGCLDCDTLYLESEFPLLFAAIGKNFNKAGDDPGGGTPSEFRTPPVPTTYQDDADWTARVRF